MQMPQSDWLSDRTLSAINIQWLEDVHEMASLPILPRRFYIRFRPFVRIFTVARIRKKYDCFAV